ncbi:LysR family transcriptional regulator [Streptomyces sp. NPDC000878]
MDVNLLRAFVAVAREGSFSAAAGNLGYTQSAVSQQVAALEKDLGVQLLHRRPVIPTEAGQRLLEHATPILLRLNAARTDVQRLSGEPPARLTLGASPLADVRHTIAVLTELQRSMPRLTIDVRTMGRDGVLEAVANGDADLGLVDGVTAASDPLRLLDSGPLTTVGLTEESVAVALPGTHPLASRSRLRLEDLVDAVWIDAPDVATPLDRLRALARTDGFRSSLHYDGTDVRSLLALVAAGAGLALLPASAVQHRREGDLDVTVTGVPLSTPRLVHRTELVHGSLTGPATTLTAAIHRHAATGRH